ncbi:MAG: Hsp33 family molecular chaperone HslO [Ramlibacter sp.]|nr:Hsp33 family molecular chaperone HslO [Ramlibacter sp.]
MSELHRFLFEGLPVRGVAVRLTDSWREVLRRRADGAAGAWPQPVRQLLGEMAAASMLMQSNIKFNGALVLQIMGDGPVKVAVAESRPDLGFRCTAKVVGDVAPGSGLPALVNAGGHGRCAITLDPQERLPGQQPYQGVVSLVDADSASFGALAGVLEHYMLQSEQLDTRLVLAASDDVAAGLLIQRVPGEGGTQGAVATGADALEDFNRIAILAASLTAKELLELPTLEVLHRLFWEEKLLRHEPQTGVSGPRFACTCSRARVAGMIRSLGADEAQGILAEQGQIEVGCDFCGQQYRFDAVDAAAVFAAPGANPPASPTVQ